MWISEIWCFSSNNMGIINIYALLHKINGRSNYFGKIVEFEYLGWKTSPNTVTMLALKSEVSTFTWLNLFVSKTPFCCRKYWKTELFLFLFKILQIQTILRSLNNFFQINNNFNRSKVILWFFFPFPVSLHFEWKTD